MNAISTDVLDTDTGEVREVSHTEAAVMSAAAKAEFDQAVVLAHAHPRSIRRFVQESKELVTISEQTAQECLYSLPRKENGRTKMIEGPSTRMAEIVASAWGNCQIGARVVEEGREFLTAQGVFYDLQKNVRITVEVRRRITGKYGRYNADMIGVTGNAACSIALRNAVFRGVPKALWAPIYEEARRIVAGDSTTLSKRRADALDFLKKQGAAPEQIFGLLAVQGVEDITLDHLTTLRGIATAIKDGETTVDEAFAPKHIAPEQPSTRAAAALAAMTQPAAEAPKEEKKAAAPTDATAWVTKLRAQKGLTKLATTFEHAKEAFGGDVPNEVHAAFTETKEALSRPQDEKDE